MPAYPKIAVVILNWNGVQLLDKFLPSVVRNSSGENIEVYIADNGSDDNSVEFITKNYESIHCIKLNKNLGFAEGYNTALKRIKAEYFVLLNSDVEVTPNWITKCMELFNSNDNIAAIQPKIISFEKAHLFEYAGASGGFIDKFGYPFCRGRILNKMEADVGQYNKETPIFWASGACMFIKSDAFKKAGGFDEDFWTHMEEIDLCWRLKSMGYEIWYQPESVVFHLGGGTLSYGSPQKVYLNFRNNLWMLFKNLPRNQFKRIFFTRLFLDGVAAVKFLTGFHFRSFMAVLRAHLEFYKNLKTLIQKRRTVQKNVEIATHKEIYPKSIMWKFFIQRKRKFSELNYNPGKEH